VPDSMYQSCDGEMSEFVEYQLTQAEARLANALMRGQDLNAFALEHDLSIHTVRNQLKSIFSKTGVSRQVDLVLLLLRGGVTSKPHDKE